MRDLISGLEDFWRDPAGRGALAVAAAIVAIGTVFYRVVEDFSWVDSLYFSVITLATVGFGDLSPQTTTGKLFTVFYVIIGIGVFFAMATTLAHHLLSARRDNERSS